MQLYFHLSSEATHVVDVLAYCQIFSDLDVEFEVEEATRLNGIISSVCSQALVGSIISCLLIERVRGPLRALCLELILPLLGWSVEVTDFTPTNGYLVPLPQPLLKPRDHHSWAVEDSGAFALLRSRTNIPALCLSGCHHR